MIAWRIAKADRVNDLSGRDAALEGGRWNDAEIPAIYLGLNASICSFESLAHQSGKQFVALKFIALELPADPALYFEPDIASFPKGWDSMPADRPSMSYGTGWLKSKRHLGLILPSAALSGERNMMLNPAHPAMADVKVVDVIHDTQIKDILAFAYGDRALENLP